MGVSPTVTNHTIASAGTRVQLFTTTTYCVSAYFESLDSNLGGIYIGNSTVSATSYMKKISVALGGFSLNALPNAQSGADGGMLDLSKIWVDSTTAAQVLMVSRMLHIGP